MFYTQIEAEIGKGDNFMVIYAPKGEGDTHPYSLMIAHVEGNRATHQVRFRLSEPQLRILIERMQGALVAGEAAAKEAGDVANT